MPLLLILVNCCAPTLKFTGVRPFEVEQRAMRKNARKANFANGARLAGSFRQSRFLSRIFCFHFPTLSISFSQISLARECTHWRIVLSSFFFPRVPWSLLCRHAHPLLKFLFRPLPNSRFATYRRWRTGQYRSERFAILSLRVVSRSCMAAGEWINAARDGGRVRAD